MRRDISERVLSGLIAVMAVAAALFGFFDASTTAVPVAHGQVAVRCSSDTQCQVGYRCSLNNCRACNASEKSDPSNSRCYTGGGSTSSNNGTTGTTGNTGSTGNTNTTQSNTTQSNTNTTRSCGTALQCADTDGNDIISQDEVISANASWARGQSIGGGPGYTAEEVAEIISYGNSKNHISGTSAGTPQTSNDGKACAQVISYACGSDNKTYSKRDSCDTFDFPSGVTEKYEGQCGAIRAPRPLPPTQTGTFARLSISERLETDELAKFVIPLPYTLNVYYNLPIQERVAWDKEMIEISSAASNYQGAVTSLKDVDQTRATDLYRKYLVARIWSVEVDLLQLQTLVNRGDPEQKRIREPQIEKFKLAYNRLLSAWEAYFPGERISTSIVNPSEADRVYDSARAEFSAFTKQRNESDKAARDEINAVRKEANKFITGAGLSGISNPVFAAVEQYVLNQGGYSVRDWHDLHARDEKFFSGAWFEDIRGTNARREQVARLSEVYPDLGAFLAGWTRLTRKHSFIGVGAHPDNRYPGMMHPDDSFNKLVPPCEAFGWAHGDPWPGCNYTVRPAPSEQIPTPTQPIVEPPDQVTNGPVSVELFVSPASGTAGDVFTIAAIESPESSSGYFYSWNISRDGKAMDELARAHDNKEVIKAALEIAGTYEVTVLIVDKNDSTRRAFDSVKIIVFPDDDGSGNLPPWARLILSPNTEIGLNETLILDATESYDRDGSIVTYRYEVFDKNNRRVAVIDDNRTRATASFADPGTYEIRLTVIDNNGAKDIDSRIIRVVEGASEQESDEAPRIVEFFTQPRDEANPGENISVRLDAKTDDERGVKFLQVCRTAQGHNTDCQEFSCPANNLTQICFNTFTFQTSAADAGKTFTFIPEVEGLNGKRADNTNWSRQVSMTGSGGGLTEVSDIKPRIDSFTASKTNVLVGEAFSLNLTVSTTDTREEGGLQEIRWCGGTHGAGNCKTQSCGGEATCNLSAVVPAAAEPGHYTFGASATGRNGQEATIVDLVVIAATPSPAGPQLEFQAQGGQIVTATDLNNDDLFDDLNANLKPDADDCVQLADLIRQGALTELSPAFDFDGDGVLDPQRDGQRCTELLFSGQQTLSQAGVGADETAVLLNTEGTQVIRTSRNILQRAIDSIANWIRNITS